MIESGVFLVDAGNSRIKWAWAANGSLSPGEAFLYQANSLPDELVERWKAVGQPRAIWVSNVSGASVAEAIDSWALERWKITPTYPKVARERLGVTTLYQPPERLGVDRWLALLATRRCAEGSVCVVDCGTAITLDVMDKTGVHIGGLIAPGLDLMLQSLAQRASSLNVATSDYHGVLATHTAGGLLSGARQAALGLIERTLADVSEVLGERPTLILTGGDAASLASGLRQSCHLSPRLVLEGLMLLAESNR
jgi:type III pantothenate kinase